MGDFHTWAGWEKIQHLMTTYNWRHGNSYETFYCLCSEPNQERKKMMHTCDVDDSLIHNHFYYGETRAKLQNSNVPKIVIDKCTN